MDLNTTVTALETVAPPALAESWDNVGLLLGDRAWPVRKALLCIDLTEAVWREAVRKQVQLIVAYHPPIFKPLSRLTADHWQQRVLLAAAAQRVAIYSPHTALDAAEGGVNDWLAGGVGIGAVTAIEPPRDQAAEVKVVVFVPPDHADRLRQAMADAGAGVIGAYRLCSFSLAGEGTFEGGADANPFIGQAGRFERVSELRMEMVTRVSLLPAVVAALRRTHPYEEPAFDVYPLTPVPSSIPRGQGRLVTLARAVTASTLVQRVRQHLGVQHLEIAAPPGRRSIRRVALCAGAGGSVVSKVPADAWVTGEMRHHDVLDAVSRGVTILLAGHTQTERPYLPVLARRLKALVRDVQWHVSRADAPPGCGQA